MNRKIALITGATAGIGYETALLLAANNFNLIITGRRKERLESLKKELETSFDCKVLTLNFDIRIKKDTAAALNGIPDEWKAIDVLTHFASRR